MQQAIDGDCQHWHRHPQTALALVLLLDQFPRHIWRGKAAAYAGDQQALELSLLAEEKGWLQQETQRARRQFWLMPRLHSEDLDVQTQALPLLAMDRSTHACRGVAALGDHPTLRALSTSEPCSEANLNTR